VYTDHTWLNGAVTYPAEALRVAGPVVGDLLRRRSVPTRFFYWFKTDGTVTRQVDPSGRVLVRFGLTRSDEYICLVLDDLSIVEAAATDSSVISLVNTDLDKFLDFMAFCEDRYPYYTEQDDIDVTIAASSSLRDGLTQMDPNAFLPGSYWCNFLADVANGDYSIVINE
jgi:hypothetical protein